MNIQKKFGLRVKQLREDKKISQEHLASLANLDRTYITRIENGNTKVSIVVIEKLSIAFGISINELMNINHGL